VYLAAALVVRGCLRSQEQTEAAAVNYAAVPHAPIPESKPTLPPSKPGEYDTKLKPIEEFKFKEWKKTYAPSDSGEDYDLRGAYKAGLTPDPTTGHWPDEYKKPNHPTFSDQSKYAVGEDAKKAGHWEGEKFVPPEKGKVEEPEKGPAPNEPTPEQEKLQATVKDLEG
jgi:hypothetical protein